MSAGHERDDGLDGRRSHDRVWTHLFVEFPMEPAARRELDERLRAEDTTLTRVVIDALSAYVDLPEDLTTSETTKSPLDDASIDTPSESRP